MSLVAFGLAACHAQTGAVSEVKSGHNGIRCDVDYARLDTTNLRGISIRDIGIGQSEKIRHLNELNAMPDAFLQVMRDGITINLAAGAITDFPEKSYLKGQVPRGWEGTGYTWDDVPGGGESGNLYLGDSGKVNNANSLAVHEASHSVDIAKSLQSNARLVAAYDAEKSSPHGSDNNSTYRLSYLAEYLAIAIDEYYCSATTRGNLRSWYPRAYAWMQNDFIEALGGRSSGGDDDRRGTYGCTPCEGGRRYCGYYEGSTWLSGAWESC
jgi:hypothetical protein